jgi:hypothetical protein
MAGGKGSVFDNDLLQLIFNGVAIPGIADNAATSPLTNLYLSLHTSDPGVVSDQSTSEAAYQGYARQAVPRDTTGFTISGGRIASPTSTVSFPASTGSATETETFAAIGTAATGTGKILYVGPITPPINVATGIAPQLTTGTTFTES